MPTANETTYNYVLHIGNSSYMLAAYKSLEREPDICVCSGGLIDAPQILQKLHKLHWSYRINQRIRLPFKRIWFRKMTDGEFRNNKPTCHVFFGGQYCSSEHALVEYIRSQNPQNKIVVYYLDLIQKKDPQQFKNAMQWADLVCTYNQVEAEKHQVVYYPHEPYSRIMDATYPSQFEHDLYFVGYAKDRLPRLMEIFDCLTSKGVRCFFQLMGVPQEQQRQQEGLIYLQKPIPYEQVIREVRRSRCILEATQAGSTGHTLRTGEAIYYSRKLLSDRLHLKGEGLFTEEQLSVFSDPAEINVEFLKSDINYDACQHEDVFSPWKFIQFLEDHFRS